MAAEPDQYFALEWQSPLGCPQQPEVEAQIRTLLDVDSRAALPSHLRAKGVIAPSGERFTLTVSIQSGQTSGARVIDSVDCHSLGKAAAVVLGLLIRKERDLGRDLADTELGGDFEPPPSSASPAPAAPVPQEAPVASTPPHEGTSKAWGVLVRGPTATLDYWTLPKPGWGFGVSAGIFHRSWRFFAAGTLWLSQEKTVTGGEGYRASFERQSYETWGCRGWRSGGLELSPCIVMGLDRFKVSASGDRLIERSQRLAIVSAGAGLNGYWHLASNAALVFSTTGRFWIHKPTFVVEGIRETQKTHTIPAATVLASVGTEWIF